MRGRIVVEDVCDGLVENMENVVIVKMLEIWLWVSDIVRRCG